MKKGKVIQILGLGVMFMVMLIFVGYLSVPKEALAKNKVYRWRMQTYLPRAAGGAEEQMFVDDIERMSGGQIKITLFCGGELIPTNEIMRAVGAGTIEIGHGSASYYPELDIGNIEMGLPMSWSNGDEATIFFNNSRWQALATEAYNELNLHYLITTFEAPYCILTTNPVKDLDDLKKMKIRATSGPAKMFAKLGIPTVHMPIDEVYLALTTKQIDGVLYGGAMEYKLLGLQDIAKYYLGTPILNPVTGNTFINLGVWNKLPDNLKAIIEAASFHERWRYWTKVLKEEYLTREADFVVTTLPAEDIAKLKKAALAVWDEEATKSVRCAQAVKLLKELKK